MKVRSLRRRKRSRQLIVVAVALAMVLVGWLVPKAIGAVSAIVLTPVHALSSWLSESEDLVPRFFRDRAALTEEIERLENELAMTRASELTKQRLLTENQELRALVRADEPTYIAAAVIARPDELPYDLLQLDRGSAHGVEVGAPVFAGNDVVIGLVVHTALQYSFVELLSSSGFSATVYVNGPNVVANLQGMGGGIARVHLPQGLPLREGDLVVLPTIVAGVVGRISYLENEPTQAEQYGYIAFDIPIASLHYVSVGELSLISKSPKQIDENMRALIRSSLLVPGLSSDLGTTSPTSTEATISTDSVTRTQP